MKLPITSPQRAVICMALATLLCLASYWPGLHGGFLFDDFPNIVHNPDLQIHSLSGDELSKAAWSSRSSVFRRPLASLSFALNFLAAGMNPYWMKLTNVLIHIANGLLLFALTRRLALLAGFEPKRAPWLAAFVAGGWLLLPINLSAVLYVVQRMESLANLFVLIGLLGYVHGRQQMARAPYRGGTISVASLILGTLAGLASKETAVLLPLYACCIEWFILDGFRSPTRNERLFAWITFTALLALPLIAGLAILLPSLLKPGTWANRDFTLAERLLTEPRIIFDYLRWTLLPTPTGLSFYHDDIVKSSGWLTPLTTLFSILGILMLAISAFLLKRINPLLALGLALFLSAQTLTATVIPLELVFEHRNYFASFGMLLSVGSILVAAHEPSSIGSDRLRGICAVALLAFWCAQTAMTARSWSSPIRFAVDMAQRAPQSSRAQYRLGATLMEASGFDPKSPLFDKGRAALERSAALPDSSILGDQALILMACRSNLPVDNRWWDSLFSKLSSRRPRAEDISSIMALTKRDISDDCALSKDQMFHMFQIALSHPHPTANVLSAYADFAWNALGDKQLAARVAVDAAKADPSNAHRQSTMIIMLAGSGQREEAKAALARTLDKNPEIFSTTEQNAFINLISNAPAPQH